MERVADVTRLAGMAASQAMEPPPALTQTQDVTKAEEAAKAFESYLVGFLSQAMRSTLPEDSVFRSGAMDMFASVFDQALGDALSEGQGLGLREQLVASFLHRAQSSGEAAPSRGLRAPHADATNPLQKRPGGFGIRKDPFTGEQRMHQGKDIGGKMGQAIRAAMPGKVVFTGTRGGYGQLVIVDHGNGMQTRYGHCSGFVARPGDVVNAGDPIAKVGSTGRSTAPHLHFEVRVNGAAVDPEAWSKNLVGP